MILDRARHLGRGLARADDNRAALGRRRQMRRQAAGRIRSRERRLEQLAQQGLRRKSPSVTCHIVLGRVVP
jgi:hypothetical protein